MGLDPFFHCLDLAAEFLLAGLYPATEKRLLSVHSAIKREAKKVKGIRFSFSSCFSVPSGKPPKFYNLRLFLRQFQSIFLEAFFQPLSEYFCFILILETADKVITITDPIAFAFTLSLYDYIEPVIQYIMQIDICKYWIGSIPLYRASDYAESVAKTPHVFGIYTFLTQHNTSQLSFACLWLTARG